MNDVSGTVGTVSSIVSGLAIIMGISMVIGTCRKVSTNDFVPRDWVCHSFGILGCSAWNSSSPDCRELALNEYGGVGRGGWRGTLSASPWLMVKLKKIACSNS